MATGLIKSIKEAEEKAEELRKTALEEKSRMIRDAEAECETKIKDELARRDTLLEKVSEDAKKQAAPEEEKLRQECDKEKESIAAYAEEKKRAAVALILKRVLE